MKKTRVPERLRLPLTVSPIVGLSRFCTVTLAENTPPENAKLENASVTSTFWRPSVTLCAIIWRTCGSAAAAGPSTVAGSHFTADPPDLPARVPTQSSIARGVRSDGTASGPFEDGARGSRPSLHAATTLTAPMSIREFQCISGTTHYLVGNHIRNPAPVVTKLDSSYGLGLEASNGGFPWLRRGDCSLDVIGLTRAWGTRRRRAGRPGLRRTAV